MIKFGGRPATSATKAKAAGIPLAPADSHMAETGLGVLFKTAANIAGAVVFSGRSEKFEHILIGDDDIVKVPIEEQCPLLLTSSKDLGDDRMESFNLKYEVNGPVYESRLFMRTVKGCTQLQISGALSYLNRRVDGRKFEDKLRNYDNLTKYVRDFIHPNYKIMTRTNPYRQYLWIPLVTEGKSEMRECEIVFGGDLQKMIALLPEPEPHIFAKPRPVTLVKPLPALKKTAVSPVESMKSNSNVMESVESSSQDMAWEKSVAKAMDQEEKIRKGATKCTTEECDANKTITEEFSGTPVQTEVQDEVLPEQQTEVDNPDDDCVKDPDYNQESGADGSDSDSGQENSDNDDDDDNDPVSNDEGKDENANKTDGDDNSEDGSEKESDRNEGDQDGKTDNNAIFDDINGDVTAKTAAQKKAVSHQGSSSSSQESNQSEVDQSKKPEEEILADDGFPMGLAGLGQRMRHRRIMDGTMATLLTEKPIDECDNRSLAQRKLHAALPVTEKDIPDIVKKKFHFNKLVFDLRPLEMAYNNEAGIEVDLPDLDDAKLMTKKCAEAERKRIISLMSGRDKFLRQHRLKYINLREKMNRAKNSLKGRKETKRQMEDNERKRLAAKAEDEANQTIEDARTGKLSRKRVHISSQPMLQTDGNTTLNSSYGVQPLNRMLSKQARKPGKAKRTGTDSSSQGQTQVQTEAPVAADKAMDVSLGSSFSVGGPPMASSSLLHEASLINMRIPKNVPESGKTVKGYIKVESYNMLLEVCRNQKEVARSQKELVTKFNLQMKEVQKRLKNCEKTTSSLVANFNLMKSAFLEYDLSKNLDLNEAQAEITVYLPMDELGEKFDFMLTNPATSKTVAKHIMTKLSNKNIYKPTVEHLVAIATPNILSAGLRAHMSTATSVTKCLKGNKSRGWHKIPTPESFNAFASKFLLPLLTKKGVTVKDKSWKAKMKEHFKNASHGYFNHYCGQQDSQGAWIDKRHEERVKLLRKNMVGTEEEIEARIVDRDQEIMNYAADSGYKSIEALFQSPQTQIYQKTSPENDPKPPALPPMDELKRKAAQLQELMNASVVITKEQQDNFVALGAKRPRVSSGSKASQDNQDEESDTGSERATDTTDEFQDEPLGNDTFHVDTVFDDDSTSTQPPSQVWPEVLTQSSTPSARRGGASTSSNSRKRKANEPPVARFKSIPDSLAKNKKRKKSTQ